MLHKIHYLNCLKIFYPITINNNYLQIYKNFYSSKINKDNYHLKIYDQDFIKTSGIEFSCKNNDFELVKYLSESNFLDKCDIYHHLSRANFNIFDILCEKGYTDILKYILHKTKYKLNLNKVHKYLIIALKTQNVQLIKIILSPKYTYFKNKEEVKNYIIENFILSKIIVFKSGLNIFKFFVYKYKLLYNIIIDNNIDSLCSIHNDLYTLKWLIKEYNFKKYLNTQSCIRLAILNGNLDIIKFINKEYNIIYNDKFYYINIAFENQHYEIVKYLYSNYYKNILNENNVYKYINKRLIIYLFFNGNTELYKYLI